MNYQIAKQSEMGVSNPLPSLSVGEGVDER